MTFDAPLWTTETPTICTRCRANRQALFALAKAQGARYHIGKMLTARKAIAACPLCAAAWKEAKRA